ncbi:BGTF surface domain-containing protein [Natrialba sp. INN-245]|uniref:BGTF surface domain-containing protein n=1 Tax=Natrialba sp. INN-245 TaxID=2690967 RepID=UPI00130FE7FF|nr:BGTF surface domain-containing protein [Natrialba sp. INN-245]MWV40109.1 PGF-CTERM sorting domain-containing protein [Natrialba sp. INN-245]
MTETKKKVNAVFMAVLMVLSVVAVSAAFAAPAAAQEISVEDQDISEDGSTVELSSSDTASINVQLPDGWTAEDISDDGDLLATNEVNWDFGDRDDRSVSFTLIPADDAEDGDSETLTVINDHGTQETFTATVDAETEPAPGNGDGPAYDFNIDEQDPWQGQEVTLTGDVIEPNTAYNLIAVDGFDGGDFDGTERVRQVTSNNDGEIVVDTGSLDTGYYFVDIDGVDESEENTFYVNVLDVDAAFDDDSVTDAGPNSVTEFEIETERGFYSIDVSADGDLEDYELFGIFVDESHSDWDSLANDVVANDDDIDEVEEVTPEDAVDHLRSADRTDETFGDLSVTLFDEEDEDDYDEMIRFVGISDTDEYDVDFAGIDEDDYEFEFEETDTEATATANISVTESDSEANFDDSVYTQSSGDLVEFTVELEDTDDAYIQFGDEDSSFVDVFYIEDDSDNGEVTFTVNTRTIGAADAEHDQVVYSDDDIVESYLHGGFDEGDGPHFWADDVDEEYLTYEEYLDELDLIDEGDGEDGFDQLPRPLQWGTDYDMTVDSDGHFIVEDGESDVNNEIGHAILDLVEPQLSSVSTWVGPSDSADEEDNVEDLQDKLTERENVAIDDQLVIKAEAEGIYGYLAAVDYAENSNDLNDGLEDGYEVAVLNELLEDDGEGVNMVIEDQVAHGNQDPNQIDLTADESDVYLLVDNDAGEFYLIVDTSDEPFDRSIENGDEFNVELEYETDGDDRFRFDEDTNERSWQGGAGGDTDAAAFPYYQPDSTQSVSTTFTLEDPEAVFDHLDEDELVQIEASDDFEITGTTNVAPGTDGHLRISNQPGESSFVYDPDVEIDSDGTFTAESTDFSERSTDTEAVVNYRIGGSTIDSTDGIFVDEVVTDDDADEADDDADEEPPETDDTDDEPPETDDTDDEPPETDDTDDTPAEPAEDDDIPGFGVAVALVALLAAAMLALRRQN